MSNKYDEQLSHLMDGESDDEAKLLAAIKEDAGLRARWERYHLIRDVMGNHLSEQGAISIAARVAAQLENEPTVLAPKRRRFFSREAIVKPAAGFAIAATIATVAVMSVQTSQIAQNAGYEVAEVKMQPRSNVASMARATLSAERKKHIRAVDSKLSNYLVKHNEHSVSARMQGALPYMRIVGDTVGQRTKHDK